MDLGYRDGGGFDMRGPMAPNDFFFFFFNIRIFTCINFSKFVL